MNNLLLKSITSIIIITFAVVVSYIIIKVKGEPMEDEE